jgi:hypothetical protein
VRLGRSFMHTVWIGPGLAWRGLVVTHMWRGLCIRFGSVQDCPGVWKQGRLFRCFGTDTLISNLKLREDPTSEGIYGIVKYIQEKQQQNVKKKKKLGSITISLQLYLEKITTSAAFCA